ncbi:hypothetical protein D0867_00107 [Hortaea werneckii]|uniref:histidine kinase n=1 Tax=Hortaea werneckii TaxID=91943 RepID=A0A3M7BPY5_HORWE|nr:hypothetical protein D0867_00107 [Hortaea werneckii]RMY41754.1 hypothetical protein D0866_00401 [Hortaea werneckii]
MPAQMDIQIRPCTHVDTTVTEQDGNAEAHSQTQTSGDFFLCPIPTPSGKNQNPWKESAVGYPNRWPFALQAYTCTLASFAYPAAIFWGEELVLLHNEEWVKAGGIAEQGQKQRGRLKADAFNGLTSALHGGLPKSIPSASLLRTERGEDYTVLVSPLFDEHNNFDGASGLLAQLLPRPNLSHHSRLQRHGLERSLDDGGTFGQSGPGQLRKDANNNAPQLDISQLGKVVDNVPLDEHPFFHRFAEMLPSGLAILDHKAQAVFVNQHFYQLTTHRGDDQSFKSWPQSIHPDDYGRVMTAYHDAFVSQKQLRTEFRAQGENLPWRLLLLTPLGDENLQHVSLREYGGFICSIVDISSEKSAELSERKAAKDARERKEQQERFIDMISHEIRNPLSAVLHCSEDIEEAIHDQKSVDVEAIRESVETINLCIQHQRNIVDDVLSFSKLDSSMLSLVPKACLPSRNLADSLKMFQPEFRKQNMDLRKQGEKRVVVSIGASPQRPDSYPPNVVFFSPDDLAYRMDATNANEWGSGEPLYIMVAVKDTGIGIDEEGQKRLFERFRQATPKTGEIYGGSGLGLNISRKLCHLHGGEIGVSSREGNGSTFGFFKVRRTERPNDYEGRPEDQALDDDNLRAHVTELGNCPPDQMDHDLMPDSLKQPPVDETSDSTPHANGKKDSRYAKTAEIAQNVPAPEGDLYAKAEGTAAGQDSSGVENLQSADVSAKPDGEGRQDQTVERPSASRDESSTRPHVLLVEDNVINQRIVFRKLEAKGFKVTTANNGREAVEAAKQAPKPSSGDKGAFDVILMDQEMPVMDGNAATREIRKLEKEGIVERIPVLGVTANVRGAQQDEMMESGMDDVISKPYKIEDMVRKINKAIGSNAPTKDSAKQVESKQ